MFDNLEVGWRTCRPDHVCLYIRQFLLPNHTGRDGSFMASSTLQGFVSSLSRCFDLQGRSREWRDETATGNPARANLVHRAVANYHQLQIIGGRRERSATPILHEDLHFMIQRMDQALTTALEERRTTTSATLLRDITFMLYLWNIGRRGQDALYADWEDMYIRMADRSVLPVAEIWLSNPPNR